ncbi:MAG: hypothetical protein ACU841_07600 [Gammaproteobacteria bacterium]
MLEQNLDFLDDINYEDLDDLPLSDHIEWNNVADEKDVYQDPYRYYWSDD